MKQKIYQIDAFTTALYSGNPAAVCILEQWLDNQVMQKIAAENNLAETAFAVAKDDYYELRWFTPEVEVDLCGHATLATAFVLYNYYGFKENTLRFISLRTGELLVQKNNSGLLTMDFPTDDFIAVSEQPHITKAIGKKPLEIIKGKTDYMLIYETQKEIEAMQPNFHLLNQLDCRGVIITAKGNEVDFVSRFFAPQCGIAEDPVTGSAHTTLTPYWSKKLNKTLLTAKQLSERGGDIQCEYHGDRVKISGNGVCYLVGEIEV
ncbi:PhzF family phenazine biosynthesis protein [Maribacter confluentis]|uniref:PhzF family phenazine biosynthesis protein n=1 Tax=Maribacter confluentis TaxID=1656093 RepID=A0ABT8RQ77_9FLAO|nr:PhzF family phenazine biosynthesis protein [Maribacter confluentis]MDO1513048.1 PhzF family phenazine biosynthesis protein [Maribacter confluentis]